MTTQLGANSNASEATKLKNAEWGPEANEAIIKEVNDYPCPLGGTMGELIAATPKGMISRVFLEEKLFETWGHGRTVLVGDGKEHDEYGRWHVQLRILTVQTGLTPSLPQDASKCRIWRNQRDAGCRHPCQLHR